ncbi:MAG: hypothetical protein BRD23_01140 [Halobacteriales archaeon SW_9_67_25]|nr:MAG: hypothetical protein BRD23_01140 [Halobacteriales archaeon SW_9_67_25]
MEPDYQQVVDVLEEAGEPLSRAELATRLEQDSEEISSALDYLRGQQVVYRIPDQGTYRLTYWPDEQECALCGETVSTHQAVELTLDSPEQGTDESMHGSLHRQCATRLIDELTLEEL